MAQSNASGGGAAASIVRGVVTAHLSLRVEGFLLAAQPLGLVGRYHRADYFLDVALNHAVELV